MKNPNHGRATRRQFITKIVPACALTCLWSEHIFGMTQTDTKEEVVHKFDKPLEYELTYKQLFRGSARGKINLIKTLVKELGEEKAIQIIKTDTSENAFNLGKRQAEAAENNDFYTYVDMFRDKDRYKNTLTMEIIEDTKKAFELKVTECLYALPYIEAGLGGEIGFAALCYMDYFWPKGFNENIELIRDKTLMQGHVYCNHRYVWQG